MSLCKRLFPVGLLGLSIMSANADTTLEFVSRAGKDSSIQTISIMGNKLRMDKNQEAQQNSILFDATKNKLIMLNHQEKAFVELNEESTAQLREPTGRRIRRLQQTGRLQAVNNFGCRVVELYQQGRKKVEWCVASPTTLKMPDMEYRTLKAAIILVEKITGKESDFLADAEGLPIRTINYRETGGPIITELKTLSGAPLSDALFQTPAGYARIDLK